MRIDNHMAGYRPALPKYLKKKTSVSLLGHIATRTKPSSHPPGENITKHNPSLREKVHIRNKLGNAVYLLG